MASKRHVRRKSCEGKVRYDSAAEAARAHHGPDIDHYRCKFCKGYHNGHRRGASKRIFKPGFKRRP